MKEDKNIKMPASDTDNIPADTEALEDSWIKGAPRQTKHSKFVVGSFVLDSILLADSSIMSAVMRA
jgi:hypothetical protein